MGEKDIKDFKKITDDHIQGIAEIMNVKIKSFNFKANLLLSVTGGFILIISSIILLFFGILKDHTKEIEKQNGTILQITNWEKYCEERMKKYDELMYKYDNILDIISKKASSKERVQITTDMQKCYNRILQSLVEHDNATIREELKKIDALELKLNGISFYDDVTIDRGGIKK
jgi:hypothetical protein